MITNVHLYEIYKNKMWLRRADFIKNEVIHFLHTYRVHLSSIYINFLYIPIYYIMI
jgi:hypothetical protein